MSVTCLAGLLLSCSASTPPLTAAALRVPPGQRVEGATRIVPPLEPFAVLDEEPGVARYLAAGGVRVRVREGRAEAAPQGFGVPVVGAVRERSGSWLFALANGSLARAGEFLGTAQLVAPGGSAVARGFGRDGALVLVDPEGVRRWALPTEAGAPPASSPPLLAAANGEHTRAHAAALAAHPWTMLAAPSTVLLATGLVGARVADEVVLSRMEQNARTAVLGRLALGGTAANCTLHSWSARVLLQCPVGEESSAYRLSLLGSHGLESLGAAIEGRLLVGREGRTLSITGACPGSDASELVTRREATELTLGCTYTDERHWREWQYHGRAELVDVFDDVALVVDTSSRVPVLSLYRIDEAERVPLLLSDPTVEVTRAGFLYDGRVAVLGHAGTAAHPVTQLAMGAPGAMLVWHSMGEPIEDLAMADSEHGLAAGPNASTVLLTEDGGISWLRAEVAVSARPETVPLFSTEQEGPLGEVRHLGEHVECAPSLCRVAGRLVHRWQRVNPPGVAVLQ